MSLPLSATSGQVGEIRGLSTYYLTVDRHYQLRILRMNKIAADPELIQRQWHRVPIAGAVDFAFYDAKSMEVTNHDNSWRMFPSDTLIDQVSR